MSDPGATARVRNVLFLCTGNTARSILAESILRRDGQGKFHTFSAGSQPKGRVHPLALRTLEAFGYPTDDLASKSWDVLAAPSAPKMDFVFTVCDNAAGETCPIWPGHPMTAHWGIDDPAAVQGSEALRDVAFLAAFQAVQARIRAFLDLPFDSLDYPTLRARLRAIADLPATTDRGVRAGAHR